jgi:hypothetical protein
LNIDTICLDAGGTLVWPNWERVRDALDAHGIAVETAAPPIRAYADRWTSSS